MNDDLITVKTLAKRLLVSVAAVYAMVDSGEIECYRIRTKPGKRGTIRFSEEQVTAYLESRRECHAVAVATPQHQDFSFLPPP